LLGVNEQPFPVITDRLNLHVWSIARERLVWIQLMSVMPDHDAEHDDDQNRSGPGEDFQWQVRFPPGSIRRCRGAIAITPQHPRQKQKYGQGYKYGEDADHHQKMRALGGGDGPLRIEKAQI